MKKYFDLGNYSRKVTIIKTAQTWFDRGMVWLFAYNHEEAIFCFEKALDSDPDCTLAYWGIAYAIGPNYNKSWEVFTPDEKAPVLEKAHQALNKAKNVANSSNFEQELIHALTLRYPKDHRIEDFQPFSDAFANAMKPIYEKNRFHLSQEKNKQAKQKNTQS